MFFGRYRLRLSSTLAIRTFSNRFFECSHLILNELNFVISFIRDVMKIICSSMINTRITIYTCNFKPSGTGTFTKFADTYTEIETGRQPEFTKEYIELHILALLELLSLIFISVEYFKTSINE